LLSFFSWERVFEKILPKKPLAHVILQVALCKTDWRRRRIKRMVRRQTFYMWREWKKKNALLIK
jgi:hypothetical protein